MSEAANNTEGRTLPALSLHIKALRLRTGLTQERFAGLLGMDQRNYSHLETGGHVPTKSQIAAARMVAFIWERELMVDLVQYIGECSQ